MGKIIEFFVQQQRLNYVLLIFIIFLGVLGYNKMPKDVFPPVKLDKIIIAGGYPGTSIDILDKMVVTKLEDELRSIDGVSKMESSIKNSRFSITLTLSKGANVEEALNDAKDVVSNVKRYFPSDMNEPTVTIAKMSIPIIAVILSSDKLDINQLIKIGKDVKREFSKIDGVSKINLYAENDRSIEITIDTKKVEAYNLNMGQLINQLKNYAYIYPAGKIEETGNQLFVSTINGNRSVQDILSMRLNIAGKEIYLKDIATVVKKYRETNVITRFNGMTNIEMGVFKNENGDAIKLAEEVKHLIKKLDDKYENIHFDTYNDASVIVRKRLNTVVSNIILGILLVGSTVWLLINGRLAFVVTIGIPTALLIGSFVIYIVGFAINIVTLLGVLLILGVLVDDAVLVAENIQRHIKMGEDKFQATINGAKEVVSPVMVSSLTTIFAFMPMFVLSGEMGEFIKMIPVAVISLVIASFLESFIFLPLHSYHTFKTNPKELSWRFFENIYKAILRFFMKWSRIFVPLFFILTLVSTVAVVKTMKFQLFPEFDSNKMYIRGQFNVNYSVEDVLEKLKPVENRLLELKKELQIKSISLLAGYQNTTIGGVELKENLFEFFIELEERAPENFIDEYITPVFSPKHNGFGTRTLDVSIIANKLKEEFKDLKIDGLEEFLIVRDKPKITKSDIEIQINAQSSELLKYAVQKLKNEIGKLDGILMLGDDAEAGIKELKLKPNRYGESLGFTEGYIARSLAPLFFENEFAQGLASEGIVQIVTKSKGINDFEIFKNFQISTPDGKKLVSLKDVVDMKVVHTFDSLFKLNGIPVKTVFANVDTSKITATEVLDYLEPTIQELENKGMEIYLKGEKEQNNRLKYELGTAFIIAIFMIFMTLLIMFNSFRDTIAIITIIPLSVIGAFVGHKILGMNLAMPSVIGILGLAGVVINNGIVMVEFLKGVKTTKELVARAVLRLKPIIITSITTFIGLASLIFYATGQAVILQPIAVSLGFGLIWGTILNLIYLPALYYMLHPRRIKKED
jgi:multidrug efflux pump subunit AcrB